MAIVLVSVVTLPSAVLPVPHSHPPLCQSIQITDAGGSISASRVNLSCVVCFMHMCVYKECLVGYNCLQSKSVCVLDHKGQIVVRWLLPDSV